MSGEICSSTSGDPSAFQLQSAVENSSSPLVSLPLELLSKIFRMLSFADSVAFGCVCNKLRQVAQTDILRTDEQKFMYAVLVQREAVNLVRTRISSPSFEVRYFPSHVVILHSGRVAVRNLDTGELHKVSLPFTPERLLRDDDRTLKIMGGEGVVCLDVERLACSELYRDDVSVYQFKEYRVLVRDLMIEVGNHIFPKGEHLQIKRIDIQGKKMMIVWDNLTLQRFDLISGEVELWHLEPEVHEEVLTGTGACLLDGNGSVTLIKKNRELVNLRGHLSLQEGASDLAYNNKFFLLFSPPPLKIMYFCSLETGKVVYYLDIPEGVQKMQLMGNRLLFYRSDCTLTIFDYEQDQVLFDDTVVLCSASVGVDDMIQNGVGNILALRTASSVLLINLETGLRLREIPITPNSNGDLYFDGTKLRLCDVAASPLEGFWLNTTTYEFSS